MRVKIKTTNFELTPAIDDLTAKKLLKPVERLIKKTDDKSDVIFDIELAKTTKHHQKGLIWRAEAQLDLPGLKSVLRAEAMAGSLREAIDIVRGEILGEIKKYKEKTRVQG